MCLERSWKPFCGTLFSSSIAFLTMSIASQNTVPSLLISNEGTGKNQMEPGQENVGCSNVVILFLAQKSLTKTDRCAGALL